MPVMVIGVEIVAASVTMRFLLPASPLTAARLIAPLVMVYAPLPGKSNVSVATLTVPLTLMVPAAPLPAPMLAVEPLGQATLTPLLSQLAADALQTPLPS